MSKPRTFEEHASRLTKLALFSNAYGATREQTNARILRYLEKYFHLVATETAPLRAENPEHLVRVHLRQALLLSHGKEARYAHTLVGERKQPLGEQYGGTNFVAVNVHGFLRGGVRVTLERPTLHLLASNNILSIEDLKMNERCCSSGIADDEHGCKEGR